MTPAIFYLLVGFFLAVALVWAKARWFSFQAQKPDLYSAGKPEFDIQRVLNGAMLTEGMIFDFRGRVSSRFVARMHADWDSGIGHMTEDFRYDSGRTQNRQWTITIGENGHFTSTAPDIIGISHGRQAGNVARLTYRIALPQEVGGHVLDVVDWMYLMEDGVVLNRSEFRKFGIKVAELFATFRQVEE